MVDRTTVARAVKKLEEHGFVHRASDAHNKKNRNIFPTPAVKAIYPFLQRENEHSNTVALNGLSEEEVALMLQLIRKLRENVETNWEMVKKGHKRPY
ncbi:hypothetical protein C8U37_11284 [Trichococcus patagoniensis]|uniref:HTH marR-type domain-containing protein n=1 Tax=Trichococcus patagoniensis TaxID=382641 RepID=A0A2T5IJ09_9LACT|nr:hypothetical protein C8U37_11284 [Trichococcus patagoniensis]